MDSRHSAPADPARIEATHAHAGARRIRTATTSQHQQRALGLSVCQLSAFVFSRFTSMQGASRRIRSQASQRACAPSGATGPCMACAGFSGFTRGCRDT